MRREKVDLIVVGEPRQMNNQASESVKFIDPFIRQLAREFPGMLIKRVDERFTSKMAQRSILESGLKKKDRRDKSIVDMVSAAIILQSFLEIQSFNLSRD